MKHPLPLRSYRKVSTERLVNCYPESKPVDAQGPVELVRAPGIKYIADLGSAGRGLALFAGDLKLAAAQGAVDTQAIRREMEELQRLYEGRLKAMEERIKAAESAANAAPTRATKAETTAVKAETTATQADPHQHHACRAVACGAGGAGPGADGRT